MYMQVRTEFNYFYKKDLNIFLMNLTIVEYGHP